ncbi:PH domain-containing protein [Mycolicibacterium komossense]|uniref:PH domain-containing protein n=1 Tax=Mycolicibacterium komossense TaxID=1779 RepID=A0ABT3CL76_9MYCO|nr:PH domain-containing protein [Mycolicibacterium komossense]MCV7230215.1 PH domain-containing protein [Mycolicibacterium komossense]
MTGYPGTPPPDWLRLSPRMLLVHPVHEVLRQVPLLVGSIVLGSATNNPLWSLLGLAVIIGLGIARWFTTAYRIDADDVQLRSGVLKRNVLSVPRNRIRSVQTDARLLHRLLGLTVLRVSTGQEGKGDNSFELDAVQVDEVSRLRAILLATAVPGSPTAQAAGTQLARWAPTWLRYSPLSFSGLVMIAAVVGLFYQAGFGPRLRRTQIAESGLDAAQRFGFAATAVVVTVVIVLASVLLAVVRSLVTFGNLVLTRRPGPGGHTLHLRHGLVRVRERTFDMRRLRGGTLREPLLVRALGGARLDAVMTGVNGVGESSLLLPPCPADTAARVLTELIDGADAVAAPLRPHGPAAARRRWTRALTVPAVVALGLVAVDLWSGVPLWVWPAVALLTGCCAALAADRVRALGHRVDGDWLVARSGSVERRRDCIAGAGVIGWTVRQTFFQRRAGVATLVAATAAGTKRYEVLDIPVELAWAVAAEASPWVKNCAWSVK